MRGTSCDVLAGYETSPFYGVGAIPITGNSKQFGAMLVTETERWRKVVEMSGQKKE
jgi:hypothetical protein